MQFKNKMFKVLAKCVKNELTVILLYLSFKGRHLDRVSPHISSEQVNLYNCGIYLYIRIYKYESVTKVLGKQLCINCPE